MFNVEGKKCLWNIIMIKVLGFSGEICNYCVWLIDGSIYIYGCILGFINNINGKFLKVLL